jgi:hypothetical protein
MIKQASDQTRQRNAAGVNYIPPLRHPTYIMDFHGSRWDLFHRRTSHQVWRRTNVHSWIIVRLFQCKKDERFMLTLSSVSWNWILIEPRSHLTPYLACHVCVKAFETPPEVPCRPCELWHERLASFLVQHLGRYW